MAQVEELSNDRTFRTKLILACLGVAVFVSTIYVVVSYRLTADLGIQTEMKSMGNQARIFHSELTFHEGDQKSRADELATILFFENEIASSLYLRAYNTEFDWQFTRKIPAADLQQLQKTVTAQTGHNTFGEAKVNDKDYLWLIYHGEQFTLELIQESSAIETTMAFVAKRLLTISIIVFWISIWLALTLSSFIAKQVQKKNDALAKLATHDTLTGLPNRLYLVELLDKELSAKESAQGCLFVIDLDKFKEVNDSFGHTAGDNLLIEIAQRLSTSLTGEQVLVRLGGDEFIIWTPNLCVDDAKRMAQELVSKCDAPVMINNLAVNTGASIGIAHYPSHADSGESLIINADTAMYKAKQQRCGWLIFDERDSADYKNRLRLRADISQALTDNELKLYFQPKVALNNGTIVGVEALVRWHHPHDGILLPAAFIDLIEHSGRVQEFGRYILRQAIIQLATWQTMNISVPIAVNLSPYNLLDPGLVDFIAQQLAEHEVEASQLEIELTENETSLNIEHIEDRLSGLKSLGITLTIDDFGTGMSSLAYIADLNVNIIKIDRAFISDIETNPKHKAIVSTAITLTDTFGCKMVAEGIETPSQAALLLAMGCDYGQGYLFSKPMEQAAATQLLATKTSLQTA